MKHALTFCMVCSMSIIATYCREKSIAMLTDSLLTDPYVEKYISVYRNDILRTKQANKRLVAFIENQLQMNGMPVRLRNLAIIESGLNNQTLSWAGAAGCWQLMPEESRMNGLVIDSIKDERFDILKSTAVAIRLLKELYMKYNDWPLVIAAYNCGSSRVDKAIRKAGKSDFWKMQQSLPQETRNHVKKFIAVSKVLDNDGSFYEARTTERLSVAGVDTIFVSSTFQPETIARFLQMPEKKLIDLNKDFQQCRRNKSECPLILPFDLLADFMLYRSEILRWSIAEGN